MYTFYTNKRILVNILVDRNNNTVYDWLMAKPFNLTYYNLVRRKKSRDLQFTGFHKVKTFKSQQKFKQWFVETYFLELL